MDFFLPLHAELTPRRETLAARPDEALAAAHRGSLPDHLPPSAAPREDWQIEVPAWCRDQRNQMTGPADDGELVVKMLNPRQHPSRRVLLEPAVAHELAEHRAPP